MSGYLKSVIKGGKCQAFRLSLRPRDPWHELLSAIQVTSPSAKKHIWREYLRCCYLCTACHCVHYRYRAQTQLSAEWVGRRGRLRVGLISESIRPWASRVQQETKKAQGPQHVHGEQTCMGWFLCTSCFFANSCFCKIYPVLGIYSRSMCTKSTSTTMATDCRDAFNSRDNIEQYP